MTMNSLVLLYPFLIHLLWKYLFHSINFAVDFIEMVPESNILYKTLLFHRKKAEQTALYHKYILDTKYLKAVHTSYTWK